MIKCPCCRRAAETSIEQIDLITYKPVTPCMDCFDVGAVTPLDVARNAVMSGTWDTIHPDIQAMVLVYDDDRGYIKFTGIAGQYREPAAPLSQEAATAFFSKDPHADTSGQSDLKRLVGAIKKTNKKKKKVRLNPPEPKSFIAGIFEKLRPA
jgi:hypothetical protein